MWKHDARRALRQSAFRIYKCYIINMFICMEWRKVKLRADCHSVQFNERTEFYDHFLLKCVQSAICDEIGE